MAAITSRLLRRFSTSPEPPISLTSSINDVKATLRSQNRRPQFPNPNPNPNIQTLQEIRRNLSAFRSSTTSNSSSFVSLSDLYKRNVIPTSSPSQNPSHSLDSIRHTLRNLRTSKPDAPTKNSFDISKFNETLNINNNSNNNNNVSPRMMIGGNVSKGDSEVDNYKRNAFVKMYDYDELGKKLKSLRPDNNKMRGNWFSFSELNERLVKLEIEEKGRGGIGSFKDLRDTLLELRKSDDKEIRNRAAQRLDIISRMGVTPSYMLSPPKDELFEKYFHPDHMSSAEKLKLELQKVRDEYKMSESDCGSARVQVAQLTTKIKHLSTVLQKKDKHSRKGLQGMVQRRKKLLKYLRRTDWDSYTLLLSKLGLRDNPDIKA